MYHLLIHVEGRKYRFRDPFLGCLSANCANTDKHIHFQSQADGKPGRNRFMQTWMCNIDETVFWPYFPESYMNGDPEWPSKGWSLPDKTPVVHCIPETEKEFLIETRSSHQPNAWVCPWLREHRDELVAEGVVMSGGTFADCYQSAISVMKHLEIPYETGAIFSG